MRGKGKVELLFSVEKFERDPGIVGRGRHYFAPQLPLTLCASSVIDFRLSLKANVKV